MSQETRISSAEEVFERAKDLGLVKISGDKEYTHTGNFFILKQGNSFSVCKFDLGERGKYAVLSGKDETSAIKKIEENIDAKCYEFPHSSIIEGVDVSGVKVLPDKGYWYGEYEMYHHFDLLSKECKGRDDVLVVKNPPRVLGEIDLASFDIGKGDREGALLKTRLEDSLYKEVSRYCSMQASETFLGMRLKLTNLCNVLANRPSEEPESDIGERLKAKLEKLSRLKEFLLEKLRKNLQTYSYLESAQGICSRALEEGVAKLSSASNQELNILIPLSTRSETHYELLVINLKKDGSGKIIQANNYLIDSSKLSLRDAVARVKNPLVSILSNAGFRNLNVEIKTPFFQSENSRTYGSSVACGAYVIMNAQKIIDFGLEGLISRKDRDAPDVVIKRDLELRAHQGVKLMIKECGGGLDAIVCQEEDRKHHFFNSPQVMNQVREILAAASRGGAKAVVGSSGGAGGPSGGAGSALRSSEAVRYAGGGSAGAGGGSSGGAVAAAGGSSGTLSKVRSGSKKADTSESPPAVASKGGAGAAVGSSGSARHAGGGSTGAGGTLASTYASESPPAAASRGGAGAAVGSSGSARHADGGSTGAGGISPIDASESPPAVASRGGAGTADGSSGGAGSSGGDSSGVLLKVSGSRETATLSAVASVTKGERISALRAQLKDIRARKVAAIAEYMKFERTIGKAGPETIQSVIDGTYLKRFPSRGGAGGAGGAVR